MYLSKLKIFGFKSFAQKVEVNFPGNGITSVVGPNGCGKSNIVDAIRWVLGEQRAKQLRSSNMQDVIFSGTADKPAMNVAEVSIIINNDKGMLPSEYSEIQITRRVSRSGESTYLLNNQECRLKDIQNLFYDTGMGAASYSLMEQRMIDAILSDKAEDRRQLFEEAAGISKYKQQRRESLRQLEKTASDLIRVEDNLNHVRKSLANYERQAKRMEEWKQVRGRLQDLEVSMAYDEYQKAREVYNRFSGLGEEARREVEGLEAQIATIEAQLEEARLAMTDDENLYKELDQEVTSQQMDIRTLEGEITNAKDRLNHIEENRRKAEEEILVLQDKIEDLQADKAQSHEVLAEEEGRIYDLETKTEELAEGRQTLRNRFEEKRKAFNERSSARIQLLESISREKQKFEKQLNQKSFYQTRLQQLEEEKEERTGQSGVWREEILERETEVNELEEKLLQIENQLEVIVESIEALQSRRSQVEEEGHQAKEEFVSLNSRKEVLQKLIAKGEGLAQGAKFLKETRGESLKGLLSDSIQVSEEYTKVVETCLGESLQLLTIDDAKVAQSLISDLKSSQKGSALLAWPSSARTVEKISLPDRPGIKGLLVDFVQSDSQSDLLKWLLKDFVLTDSIETARELASDANLPEAWYVEPEGSMWHSRGLVRGGSSGEGPGVLAQKNELETLLTTVAEAEERLNKKRELYEELRQEAQEKTEERKELEAELNAVKKDLMSHKQALNTVQSRMDAFEEGLQRLENEKSKALSGLEEIDHFLQNEGGTLTQLEKERDTLEDGFQQLQDDYHESEEEWQQAEEQYKEFYNDLMETRNRLNQNRQKLDYIDLQSSELQEQIGRRRAEKEDGVEVIERIESSIEELEGKLELENEKLAVKEGARDDAKAVFDGKVAGLEDQRKQVRDLNTRKYQLQEDTHKSLLQITQLSGRMSQIKERIFERYEVDVDTEDPEFTLVEFEEGLAKAEIAELQDRLQKIGNVNPSAMEDYEEEKERMLVVEKQYKDLDRARLSLEKTIRRLDELARKRFLETFDQIRRNFQDVFSSVMRGGEAKLTLEEGVDPLEARIEINARPTGKKMRGVALLSGGERALTATSLLFALYMVKPSPYCILDEVDGPLDDANIGRFVELLRRFSVQTQFIVVTHNKRTMAASDRLYGVTQEVKGISRIAVVKLDEAASMVG